MTVQVIIKGPSETGKSTLAAVIHNALLRATNQTYDVNVVDEGEDLINPHNKLMEVGQAPNTLAVLIKVENSNQLNTSPDTTALEYTEEPGDEDAELNATDEEPQDFEEPQGLAEVLANTEAMGDDEKEDDGGVVDAPDDDAQLQAPE